jgi:hypothetical protein
MCGEHFVFIRGAIEACPACGEQFESARKAETGRERESDQYLSTGNAGIDKAGGK